jgi:hypothetical protein
MEWARGEKPSRALMAHVSGCPDCARFLEEQRALTAGFESLAAEEIPSAEQMGAPILAEFDRSATRAKVRVLGWVAAAGLLAAASLFLFVAPPKHAAPAEPDTAQFLPIPYTVPLAPDERTTVLRMEIPVTALIAAGFQVPAMDPGATVQADVLVSQDGRARAIRPISISNSN